MNNIQNLKIKDLILALEKLPQNSTLADLDKPIKEQVTISDMIDEIINDFNWERVEQTMHALKWSWVDTGIPTIDQMKLQAVRLLEGAVKARFGSSFDEDWREGITYSTGGFEAEVYCNEQKDEITHMHLRFVVSHWTVSKEELVKDYERKNGL